MSRTARGLGIVSTWLTATGIAAGGMQAGSTRWEQDILPFAFQFAVSSLVCALALAVASGRRWLAREILTAIAVFLVAMGIVGSLLLWPGATAISGLFRIRLLYLHQFRQQFLSELIWPLAASPVTAFGVAAGAAIGIVVGLILRLKSPALSTALALGLVLAFGAGFGVLSATLTDLVIHLRLDGGHWRVAAVRPDEMASALGAVTGALCGAILVGLASNRIGRMRTSNC